MDGRTLPSQGYPMRALRRERHLYIRNFAPERWAAGNPTRTPPTVQVSETNIFSSYVDIDPSPTKAWMVVNHRDPAVAPFYAKAMGRRPARELYDVVADPYQQTNLAEDPAHAVLLAEMDSALMAELKRLADPRAGDDPGVFERYPPYNDPGYGRPADLDVIGEGGVAP